MTNGLKVLKLSRQETVILRAHHKEGWVTVKAEYDAGSYRTMYTQVRDDDVRQVFVTDEALTYCGAEAPTVVRPSPTPNDQGVIDYLATIAREAV